MKPRREYGAKARKPKTPAQIEAARRAERRKAARRASLKETLDAAFMPKPGDGE